MNRLRHGLVHNIIIAAGALLIASGCSRRPLPDPVTGQASYFIAQSIRCEVRDALRELVFLGLRSAGEQDEIDYLTQLGDQSEEAAEITAGRYLEFVTSRYKKIRDDDVRMAIERYAAGAIAYDFEFDITENNKTGGGIDLLSTLTNGTISTGISAGLDAKRKNVRNFKILDRFGELLSNRPTARECRNIKRQDNAAYPISGELNLREVLDTFISLNQSANLVGSDAAHNIPRTADTITFTTAIEGGVKPQLKLAPLGTNLEVVGANLNLWAQRVDIHKLTLALTLPARGIPVAQQRSAIEVVAIQELENQRLRAIDTEDAEIRRRLLSL